jgi:hypothetical protein
LAASVTAARVASSHERVLVPISLTTLSILADASDADSWP